MHNNNNLNISVNTATPPALPTAVSTTTGAQTPLTQTPLEWSCNSMNLNLSAMSGFSARTAGGGGPRATAPPPMPPPLLSHNSFHNHHQHQASAPIVSVQTDDTPLPTAPPFHQPYHYQHHLYHHQYHIHHHHHHHHQQHQPTVQVMNGVGSQPQDQEQLQLHQSLQQQQQQRQSGDSGASSVISHHHHHQQLLSPQYQHNFYETTFSGSGSGGAYSTTSSAPYQPTTTIIMMSHQQQQQQQATTPTLFAGAPLQNSSLSGSPAPPLSPLLEDRHQHQHQHQFIMCRVAPFPTPPQPQVLLCQQQQPSASYYLCPSSPYHPLLFPPPGGNHPLAPQGTFFPSESIASEGSRRTTRTPNTQNNNTPWTFGNSPPSPQAPSQQQAATIEKETKQTEKKRSSSLNMTVLEALDFLRLVRRSPSNQDEEEVARSGSDPLTPNSTFSSSPLSSMASSLSSPSVRRGSPEGGSFHVSSHAVQRQVPWASIIDSSNKSSATDGGEGVLLWCLNNRYVFERVIGIGVQGSVWRAVDLGDWSQRDSGEEEAEIHHQKKYVAIKIVRRSRTSNSEDTAFGPRGGDPKPIAAVHVVRKEEAMPHLDARLASFSEGAPNDIPPMSFSTHETKRFSARLQCLIDAANSQSVAAVDGLLTSAAHMPQTNPTAEKKAVGTTNPALIAEMLVGLVPHKNLLSFEAIIDDPTCDFVFFVTPLLEPLPCTLVPGGATKEGPMHPTKILSYAHDLARALNALHSRGIVHCDVKPDNLLLLRHPTDARGGGRKQLKRLILADFGLSRFGHPEDRAIGGGNGTFAFWAPELFLDERSNLNVALVHTAATDCYAFGICLYVMLYGRFPYWTEDYQNPKAWRAVVPGCQGQTHFTLPPIVVSCPPRPSPTDGQQQHQELLQQDLQHHQNLLLQVAALIQGLTHSDPAQRLSALVVAQRTVLFKK